MSVVLLSGGSGGAKLARGLYELLGDELVVVANTGDDIEIYGAHVSPDPDLITYSLAGLIDERGWGIDGDSFEAMAMLRSLGRDVWFNLGDRDLAVCIERKRLLDEGLSATEAHARIVEALGVRAAVLPMSDEPVRTRVQISGRWVGLQEWLISMRAQGPIDSVVFAANGSMNAVAASGNTSMSDELIALQPRIDEPSKPMPSLKTDSVSSETGTAKCCHVPRMSQSLRSTTLTSLVLARLITSFGVIGWLGIVVGWRA